MAVTKKKTAVEADVEKMNNEEKTSNEEAVIEYSKENPTRYPIEKLRLNCIHLFGITKSTFDGAFFNAEEKPYTIDEASSIINEWLYGKGGKK